MPRTNRSRLASILALLLLLAGFAIRGFTESANDFHFAIIGDRTGSAEAQIFGRVWNEVDLLHPDFVLNVGDTIQGTDDSTAERQWAELRPFWERYKHYPLYFTPGNHDIWSDFSRQLYERESGRLAFYSFNFQQMHFTVLDNARSQQLSPEQLRFLEDDLKANAGRHPKLVVFHRPYWIQAIQQSGSDFPLHQLAKKYGVDHIISGHGHQFVRMVRDGVAYMEVGSSGGTMRGRLLRGHGFPQGAFYHFVWAHVTGGKVNFTIKELSGPMGQGRMFRAEDWDENGPKFDTGDPALKEKPLT
jgi:3',5'-cyclic AMP phosphodiesterase CpdA